MHTTAHLQSGSSSSSSSQFASCASRLAPVNAVGTCPVSGVSVAADRPAQRVMAVQRTKQQCTHALWIKITNYTTTKNFQNIVITRMSLRATSEQRIPLAAYLFARPPPPPRPPRPGTPQSRTPPGRGPATGPCTAAHGRRRGAPCTYTPTTARSAPRTHPAAATCGPWLGVGDD
jgi:hypothetical protein